MTPQCHSSGDNGLSLLRESGARSYVAYTIGNNAVLQVTFVGTLFEQQVMTTFHYRYNGPDEADGAALALSIITGMANVGKLYSEWVAAVSESVTSVRIWGQWIYPSRYRKVVFTPVITSGAGGQANSPNQAMVVTGTSDEATRHGVANKHLPGVPTVDIEEGVLEPTLVDKLGDLGDEMRQIILTTSGSMRPVIYNRANPPASLQITGYLVNNTARVERRRTLRLGS